MDNSNENYCYNAYRVCDRCHKDVFYKAKSHSMDKEVENHVEATCATTGVNAKKCLYCSRKTTEITPVNPLKHERGSVVYGERNAENCTIGATVSCTLCGKEVDGWNEPRHDYEEETFVCTRKGCNSVKEIPSSYFTYSLSNRGGWAIKGINRKKTEEFKKYIILPLAGLLYCPDCGGKIKYGFTDNKKKGGSIRRVSFYNCGTYTRVGKYACSSHWIGYNELQEIVLNDIRAKANLVIDDEKREREEFIRRKQRSASVKVGAEKKRLLADKKRLTEPEKLIQSVYEDKVSGKIPEEICIGLMEKYLEEKKTLSARVSESEAIVTENEKNTADVDEFIRRLKKYASAEELTREMCIELIERITIGKVVKDKTAEREIHIYYKLIQATTSGRKNSDAVAVIVCA